MKQTLLISFLLSLFLSAGAKHITGGEIIYDFVSATANSKTYRITLWLFRDEISCGADPNCSVMPATARIGIFSRDNNSLFGSYHDIGLSSNVGIPNNGIPPCMTNPPNLSYTVGSYTFTIELPNNNAGYTAAYQTCCRIDGIMNVGNSIGATYATDIPGTFSLAATVPDNSPRFNRGISVVCFNKAFSLDFSAVDPDMGDQLVYSMCSAYDGGGATNASPYDVDPPPYHTVNYINGFSGFDPLGPQASIDPNTGIISGIAPDEGRYVVSVCVASYRNGVFLGTHRKDFIITVAPCDLAGADLNPNYITCDGFNYTFENLQNSPLNLSFYWEFGDPGSGTNNVATTNPVTHVFSDTGIYTIKLVVNRGDQCADSTYAQIKVYPGYFPAMDNNSPRCTTSPVQFDDNTTATYGYPSAWFWDFGNPSSLADTSHLQNPVYTYTSPGTYIATLTVESSKGCIATITDTVEILEKPPFTVTNDTLHCSADNMQLHVSALAPCCVTWSPNYNIDDIHSFNPVVHPLVSTTYSVSYSDNFGCSTNDTVRVNVVDTVSLKTGNDTTICRGDGVALNLTSDALYYTWTESPAGSTLLDPSVKNAVVVPVLPLTTYYVTGRIGQSCVDSDSIKVRTVPYPVPNAGPDQVICVGTSTSIQAGGGSIYSWSPTIFLSSPNTANTNVVSPTVSTAYVVSVRDTLGCPKPVTDGVMIKVNYVTADAGPRDTSVVMDQPLQLNGTGADDYLWIGLPTTQWLSSTTIASPISNPQDDITYVLKVTDSIGCFDTDTITVHFFKLVPGLYIPSAFSPNGDGTNEILVPKALGLKSVENFRIYNRWGNQVFSTKQIGKGWDGRFKGADQSSGTYVWYAEGTDWKNNKIYKKGYVVLIR